MSVEVARLIPLRNRKGKVIEWAVVSEEDAEWVNRYRWSYDRSNGYVQARIDGKKVYLHRFVMECSPGDGVEVDHKNQDLLDCRRTNLRKVNRHGNKQNLAAYRGSTSKYRGVCWVESKKVWEASVRVNGRRVYCKRFKDEDEAGAAVAAARARLMPFSSENTDLPTPLFEEYVS